MKNRDAHNIVKALDSRPNLSWTKEELKDAARSKGLSVSGTKDQILERLIEHELKGGGVAKRPKVARSSKKSNAARHGKVTLTSAQMKAARQIIAQELEDEHRNAGYYAEMLDMLDICIDTVLQRS